jgi:hypothetical protein
MPGSSAHDRQQEFLEAAKRAAIHYRAERAICAGAKPRLAPAPGGRETAGEAWRETEAADRRRTA